MASGKPLATDSRAYLFKLDRPGLDRRQRALVAVAAFTALRLDAQAAKFAQSALNVGLSSTEIIETVIQTGPYSGLAPPLNARSARPQAIRGVFLFRCCARSRHL